MEQVRTFAERVLFGTTLREKLAPPPAGLADDAPGAPMGAPEAPGRPEALRLRRDGVRAERPALHELEDDDQRGRLLHFFANHELLATELMALVLLRFPDAPRAFRAGVLRTLREEQMHTRLYLRRMRACGVRFGDLPVNGFFWNCVADMATPLDYVTRLSLTFEQANLDYARHFAGVFQRSGDETTARLLERIYRDEIAHVGYGLRWFRAWKEPGQTDWDAFRRRLVLPLSAARAKGLGEFNEEGRRAAGLDETFIRELRVYSRSRGRTPNLFWFNPEAERHAAGSPAPTTPVGEILRRDLAILPALAARRDDLVLVPERPSVAHLERLHTAGIELPELMAAASDDTGSGRPSVAPILGRRLHALHPWAWSPETGEIARQLADQCARRPPTVDPQVFSKARHAGLLASLLPALPARWTTRLVPPECVGRALADLDGLPAHRPLVVKAAFSTAGRDRVILRQPTPSTSQLRWIERRLAEGDPLWAEPWLDRVLDLSFHFDHHPGGDGVRPRGFIRLENSPDGRFRRAIRLPRFTDGLPAELRRFLAARDPGGDGRPWVRALFEDHVAPATHAFLAALGHEGPVGIDALVCRWTDGTFRLKPIVEVNPRLTMGRITLELARHVEQHAAFALAIHPAPATRSPDPAAPPARFPDLAARWALDHPVRLGRTGRIASGHLPLNDPETATGFLAVLECPPPGTPAPEAASLAATTPLASP